MLPFIGNKDKNAGIAGTIIKNRTPDEKPEETEDKPYTKAECGKDILAAIKADDHEGLADAIKELMQIPDDQEESIEPHSYDAQNMKAGQE